MARVWVSEQVTYDQLLEVYSDPYIHRVGHDHRPASPIVHPNVRYLSAWVDDQFCGLFMAIESGFIELDLHALLKRSAIKHSRELGRSCIDWAFYNPNIMRVTAYVVEGLESARNYCLKLGFVEEGMRRDAYMVNGELKGVYILGMTRKDWSK